MAIPHARPYVGTEEIEAVTHVLASGWLGIGAVTKQFEAALKAMLDCKQIVAVSSGTAALHLALVSLGIGEGSEVLVPSMTFCASIQAIIAARAVPVFVDIDPETLCCDVDDMASRITPRTRAIMPVHFGGQPCDMDTIIALARQHRLLVVEDAAHAFGSSYKEHAIGTIGHATCFSFDPIKTITCGDGGAVALQDQQVAERIINMRLLGIDTSTLSTDGCNTYQVTGGGYRYHMSNLHAAIGLQQLKKFPAIAARRREIWRCYAESLQNCSDIKLLRYNLQDGIPFHFVARILNNKRDGLLTYLRARGIEAAIHYPPNHVQPFFQRYATPLPQTEMAYTQILTLPLYPAMSDDEVAFVVEAVKHGLEEIR
jgi:dTDP-4-amino-4,6-dideoxygalactose transaminase